MHIVPDLVLVDLDDPMQAARNRLDAVEFPAGLDLSDNFVVADHQRNKGVPRAEVFAHPHKAPFARRLNVCSFRRHGYTWKQVEHHRAAQFFRAVEPIRRSASARANGNDTRKLTRIQADQPVAQNRRGRGTSQRVAHRSWA